MQNNTIFHHLMMASLRPHVGLSERLVESVFCTELPICLLSHFDASKYIPHIIDEVDILI